MAVRAGPDALLRITGSASNTEISRAVLSARAARASGVISRQGKRAEPAASGTPAFESSLDGVVARAAPRGRALAEANDRAVRALKSAHDHVVELGSSYQSAWDAFVDVLKRGDADIAKADETRSLIEGLVLGTLMPLVGEEIFAGLKASEELVEAQWSEFGRRFVRTYRPVEHAAEHGVATKAAEHFAIKSSEEAVMHAAHHEGARPTETAELAGPTASENFKRLLERANTMVQAFPELGVVANTQDQLALAASELARSGRSHPSPDAQAEAQRLFELDASSAKLAEQATASVARFEEVAQAIMAVPLESVDVIEGRLWTQWMANLEGPPNGTWLQSSERDVLESRTIQQYLVKKGLWAEARRVWDPGAPGGERAIPVSIDTAMHDAQRRWLIERGVPADRIGDPESRVRGERMRDSLKAKLVGRTGSPDSKRTVRVDGESYRIWKAEVGGTFDPEDEVEVTDVHVKESAERVPILEWDASMFELEVSLTPLSGLEKLRRQGILSGQAYEDARKTLTASKTTR